MAREGQTRHEVYPGDLAELVEQHAKELGVGISGYYRQAVREKLQREFME